MRKFWMLALLVGCFGVAAPGCSKEENKAPTTEDAKKAADDAANKAKDAMPK